MARCACCGMPPRYSVTVGRFVFRVCSRSCEWALRRTRAYEEKRPEHLKELVPERQGELGL